MIVRGEFDQPFVPIWNRTARDRRVSFRARGVLTYILSLPPGARTTIEEIAKEGTEGREAVARAMRELEATGYIRRVRVRGEAGQIRTDTHVFGSPQEASPETGSRGPVPPAETQESPGHTGPQETGLRRAGAVKKKTGTTENENEDERAADEPIEQQTLISDETSTPSSSVRPSRNEKTDQLFEDWYASYPRKIAKGTARTAFARALKKGDSEALVQGTTRWVEAWAEAGTELNFIPHPSTFLNQERWNDVPPPAPRPQGRTQPAVPGRTPTPYVSVAESGPPPVDSATIKKMLRSRSAS